MKLKDIYSLDPARSIQGAYVQVPNKNVNSFFIDNKMLLILDFASLYPTIMIWLNVHFKSVKHRFYNVGLLDKIINFLYQYKKKQFKNKEVVRQQYVEKMMNNLNIIIKNYLDYDENGEKRSANKKKERQKYIDTVYRHRLYNILRFIDEQSVENLFEPKDNDGYFRLIDLIMLMETIHLCKLGNFHTTALDYITRNSEFENEYKNSKFIVIENVHERHRKLKILNYNDFKKMADNHIMTPYGTMNSKQSDYVPHEILDLKEGRVNRGNIKNLGLLLEAIAISMKSQHIDKFVHNSETKIIDILLLDKKAKSLIDKYNLKDYDGFTPEELEQQSISNIGQSDAYKVVLNSAYGVNGLSTFNLWSPYVSNIITTTARTLGILSLQYSVNKGSLNNFRRILNG